MIRGYSLKPKVLSFAARSDQRGAISSLLERVCACSQGTSMARELSTSRGAGQKWRPGGKRSSPSEKAPAGRGSKGGSSGQWMKRHLKDPYVSAAVDAGVPSRAAYKLVEINDKHGILFSGDRVLDLGAAPGGWSVVAARIVHGPGTRRGSAASRGARSNSKGGGAPPELPPPLPATQGFAGDNGGDSSDGNRGRRRAKDLPAVVIAVDLLDMEELDGVEVVKGDFREAEVEEKILTALKSRGSIGSAGGGSVAGNSDTGDVNLAGKEKGDGKAELYRGWSSSEQLFPSLKAPTFDVLELAAAATGREVSDEPERSEKLQTQEQGVGAERSTRKEARVRANVVLSDMAPSFTGDRDTDQGRVAQLLLDAFDACLGDESRLTNPASRKSLEKTGDQDDSDEFIDDESEGEREGVHGRIGLLARGGTFLGKFLAGRDEREVQDEAKRLFEKVKIVKPPASRSGSSEMYLLATGFLK